MLIQCCICMFNVVISDSANTTACGHVFHISCLDQWLSRSSTCPQCRSRCPTNSIRRLYFNSRTEPSADDAETIQVELDDANLQLTNLRKELSLQEAHIKVQQKSLKCCKDTIVKLESYYELEKSKTQQAKAQIEYLKRDSERLCAMEKELKEKDEKLEELDYVRSAIDSAASEIEQKLQERRPPKQLVSLIVVLKRKLYESECKKRDISNTLKVCQSENHKLLNYKKELSDTIVRLESDNFKLKDDLSQLKNTSNKPQVAVNEESSVLLTTGNLAIPDVPSSTTSTTNSPYLNIAQSNVGLSPLLKRRFTKPARHVAKIAEDVSNVNLSIFNNPRKILKLSSIKNSSLVYNGTGGTERKENFVGFPQAQSKTITGNAPSSLISSFNFHSNKKVIKRN